MPSYKHYNSRGDVVAATDASGSLTYQAAYEAFGKHGDTASSEEWGDTADRQQANTKDEDPTGLLNEGFRYRDLETGTFITRDTLGFVDGPNVYTYVDQNPWTKFDPLGLKIYEDGYFDSGTYWKNVAGMLRSENPDWGDFSNEFLANGIDALGSALTPKDHHENYNESVDRIAAAGSSTAGDNMLQQGVSAVAATISEAVGTTDLLEAGYGIDVQGNALEVIS